MFYYSLAACTVLKNLLIYDKYNLLYYPNLTDFLLFQSYFSYKLYVHKIGQIIADYTTPF